MRILYWTDLFYPHIGGVETFSADLVPALQARGHEVNLVASIQDRPLPSYEKIGTIPVHRFPMWEAIRKRDFGQLAAVRRDITALKQRLRPDVVHLHFGATAWFHMQTRAGMNPPTLTTVHAIPDSSLGPGSLFDKVVRASAAVNAVSARGARRLGRAFPGLAERISHVYYGLACPAQQGIEIVPPRFEEPVILCLGRLTAQKGFDLVLKAFALVVDELPAARLRIVGEGVEEAALKRLAADLGITDRVDFAGAVPPEAVFEVMNGASMILLPSRFEGLPLVALQAARMQRPIVCSDVDGLPELIVDGESGRVLEDEDARQWAAAIVAMAREPGPAVAMGQAAGRQFEANFSFEQCVSRYEELYRHAVATASTSQHTQPAAL